MIRLSIVIPCYNMGVFLEEAVQSVMEAASDDVEMIIVNDGSTDEATIRILKGLSEKGYAVFHQQNKGLAGARNAGILLAKGEYILPLDSDNKIRPEYITQGINILDQHEEIGVVFGDMQYFGEKTDAGKVADFHFAKLIFTNYIDACAVYRKKIWEEIGGYDETMPHMGWEDWDFWLRTAMRGWRFHKVNTILYDYRVRNNSMIRSRSLEEQNEVVAYIFNKKALYALNDLRSIITKHYIGHSFNELSHLVFEKVKSKLTATPINRF